jgi:hypothetical protein
MMRSPSNAAAKDFFEQSRHDALTLLHKDDQQAFVNAFSKENVLENIDSSGSFTYTYRMLVNGEPVYYNNEGDEADRRRPPYHSSASTTSTRR